MCCVGGAFAAPHRGPHFDCDDKAGVLEMSDSSRTWRESTDASSKNDTGLFRGRNYLLLDLRPEECSPNGRV